MLRISHWLHALCCPQDCGPLCKSQVISYAEWIVLIRRQILYTEGV